LLILGDTNSALAAISAKRRKIPIFHMEAGNRCFDQRVPEEINRKIIDHIADINLPYSTIARDYLIKEGLPADRIIKTGSPMYEVINYYREGIDNSLILKDLELNKESYFLISCHREENIDNSDNFNSFIEMLNALAEIYNMPIIVSTHPRTRKKVEECQYDFSEQVQFLKPMGFKDYLNLQINAQAVISDSGTITEESSILNFPAINIRQAHERPEGMEEGAVMLAGLNKVRVLQALNILETQSRGNIRDLDIVSDYDVTNVSEKVVRIILSHVDFINSNVWKKH
jgi:UDP-N-acetyl-L-fucosamine synthase